MNNIEKYISIRTILLCLLCLKFKIYLVSGSLRYRMVQSNCVKLVTKRGGTNSSRYVTRCQHLKV